MTENFDRCYTPACRTRPEPGYAPRGLCAFHEAEGLDAIGALPCDFADLQPLVWDKQRGGIDATGSTGGFGPSEPINYAADTLAREIAYTAVIWEIVVRERAGLSEVAMRDWPGGDDLDRAARILTAHYPVLLAIRSPYDYDGYDGKPASAVGADVVVALTALHRRAASMVGITTRTSVQPGHCPHCGHETLRHRDGSDTVWCVTCRQSMTWNDYQDTISIVPLARAA